MKKGSILLEQARRRITSLAPVPADKGDGSHYPRAVGAVAKRRELSLSR